MYTDNAFMTFSLNACLIIDVLTVQTHRSTLWNGSRILDHIGHSKCPPFVAIRKAFTPPFGEAKLAPFVAENWKIYINIL